MRVSSDKLPGHALALSLQKVWEIIRDQKDLNLPAHKVCARTSPSHSAKCAGVGCACQVWRGFQGGEVFCVRF